MQLFEWKVDPRDGLEMHVYQVWNTMAAHYMGYLRDVELGHRDFVRYSCLLARILVPAALDDLPLDTVSVVSRQTNQRVDVSRFIRHSQIIEIPRASRAITHEAIPFLDDYSLGYVLMQREKDKHSAEKQEPRWVCRFENVRRMLHDDFCFVCDPMFVTGRSVEMVVTKLHEKY